MKINFSEEADRQLSEIAANIAEYRGSLAARKFYTELERKLELASLQPEMYPATLHDVSIRRIILTTRPHVCFYEVIDDTIVVISVSLNHPRAEKP